MLISMFCWGLSWTSGKIIAGYGDAASVALFRSFFSFASLLILLLILRVPLTIRLKGWPILLAAAGTLSLYNFIFLKGLFLGKAGAGGVLVTTLNPLISYFLALFISRRRPTSKEALGLLLGLIAGVVLLHIWNQWEGIFSTGNLFFVACSFTWALLSLFTSKSSNYGSPVAFSLWIYGLSSVIMLLLTKNASNLTLFRNGDALFWGNMFFGSVITTGMATTFFFVATSRLGASKASSFIFMVPVSAAFGSWIFLQEIPQWNTILGGLIGIGAVYILNSRRTGR